jgi:hypothetical protein
MKATPVALTGRPLERPWRDVVFLTALLALAVIPLVALRGHPLLFSPAFQLGVLALGVGLVSAWLSSARRVSPLLPGTDGTGELPGHRRAWLRPAAVAGALFVLTIVAFQIPLREHFWGGYDEITILLPEYKGLWCSTWDSYARPLTGLSAWLGETLTPDRIEGHLWLAGILCCLNALLLAGIVHRLLPGAPAVAIAAGALFICHRGDPARFFVMWTTNYYWTSLGLLLLAIWLLLKSAASERRTLLTASCVALAASLLSSEAGYPIALLGPGLLWLTGMRGARLLVWSYAWLGTTSVMAARLARYLLEAGGTSYQAGQLSGLLKNPDRLVSHLRTQGEPFLTWFQGFQFDAGYWLLAGAGLAAAAAVAAVLIAGRVSGGGYRGYLVGPGVAALAAVGGLAPFLPIPWVFRTQFYAAPAEAALIALGLAAPCSVLGRRAGGVAFALAVGLLAANSAAEARRSQDRADRHVNFVKTVRILRQVHAVAPALDADTLVVLVTEDGEAAPLGPNSSLAQLSHTVLGYFVTQVNCVDPVGGESVLLADGVVFGPSGVWGTIPYEKVVAFHVATDGTVSLLRRFPEHLLPDGKPPAGYNPLARLKPGPIPELRYLRYPSWVSPPRDVVDPADGLAFGEGWSEPEAQGEAVFRRCGPDAVLVVNPMERTSRTILLDLEPDALAGGSPCRVEVCSEDGRVLAQAPLQGRQQVSFAIPTDPARVSVLLLRGRLERPGHSHGEAIGLRAFLPGVTKLPSPSGTTRPREIARGGLRIGGNWYPLETWQGQTFRWFNTGAELVAFGRGSHPQLVLELEPGPGMGGQPCRLRVVAPNGVVLHEVELTGRAEVRCPIPADLPAGARLRLEVIGGGTPTPGESRILNARAFRCEWADSREIARGGLQVGNNWYALETWEGQTFRWFNTGAELIALEHRAGSELLLDLEPGPGMGGQPCRLRVVAPNSVVLHEVELTGRAWVRCPVPADLPAGATLRLEVTGGGTPTPGESRILNARAFRCEWGGELDPIPAP